MTMQSLKPNQTMRTPIGTIIRQKIKEDGRTAKAICELMDMTRGNLDKIYQKESIATDLLAKFCTVLKYDFFVHVNPNRTPEIKAGLHETLAAGENTELKEAQAHIRELEREITFLTEQVADLKRNLLDKDEIISLQKEKIAMLQSKLAEKTSSKGK